jgi:hypothetical protein
MLIVLTPLLLVNAFRQTQLYMLTLPTPIGSCLETYSAKHSCACSLLPTPHLLGNLFRYTQLCMLIVLTPFLLVNAFCQTQLYMLTLPTPIGSCLETCFAETQLRMLTFADTTPAWKLVPLNTAVHAHFTDTNPAWKLVPLNTASHAHFTDAISDSECVLLTQLCMLTLADATPA